jgi:hypothetical protein
MTYQKSLSLARTMLFAFFAVCLLASCQDKEEVLPADPTTEEIPDENGNLKSNIVSLTIVGENTEFAESVECTTCTYVVAKNTTVIDGQELGLKPGSIICLDKALQYGELSFVNLKGTVENPIFIGITRIPGSSK